MDDSKDLREGLESEDKVFGSLNQLTKSLHNLDERGLVLSLAAFAEDALGLLLKAYMLPISSTHQLLEGFNAPLGTFSSRIKAAYSLGLIENEQYDDLEHLRKIRNEFAHSWKSITFAHASIAAHIRKMNYSSIDDAFPESSFDKIRTSISSILVELSSAAHQIEKQGRRVQVKQHRLLALFPGDIDQQIEAARAQLIGIRENLKTAVDERNVFYKMLLQRLDLKLYALSRSSSENYLHKINLLRDEISKQ